MKVSLILALVPFGHALVGLGGGFSGSPAGGLQDMTFGIKMNSADYRAGFYFAQQYWFQNQKDGGYTGLQPEPLDGQGREIVHGVFSSFIAGTTTDHPNCHSGADGGAGVSCKVEVPGAYKDQYNFVVKNAGRDKWAGAMVNTVTGVSTDIGSWTLPSGSGGLKSGTSGFVEWYPWNGGTVVCQDLPFVDVTFLDPTSTTPGAGTGKNDVPYNYGDCKDKSGFATKKVTGGQQVNVGFGSPNTNMKASKAAADKAVAQSKTTPQPDFQAGNATATATSGAGKPTGSRGGHGKYRCRLEMVNE